jgi:hypothetical protein
VLAHAAVPSFVKTHNREFFYKYTRAERALEIFDRLTVWWCSPLLFNDPFDTQMRLRYGFSFDAVPELLAARIERMLRNNDPVPSAVSPKLRELVTVERFLRDHGKLDELIAGAPGAFREGAEAVERQLADENRAWQATLRSMRVFCVSEIRDDGVTRPVGN